MQSVILAEIDAALAQQDIRRAEVVIARALRSTFLPLERAELLLRRAHARLSDARPDDALDDLESCLEINPSLGKSAETQVLQGDIYFARFELATVGFAHRSDAEQALKIYRTILEEHSDFQRIGWIHYQIGRIHLTHNDTAAAQAAFQQSRQASCHPEHLHAVAEERLGFIALVDQRQPDIAIQHFENALKLAPEDMNPHWMLQLQNRISHAYLKLGKTERAAETIQQALREIENSLNPNQRAVLPEAYLCAAEIMAHLRNFEEEAIELYGRFLQISPHPVGIDVTWSSAHEQVGYLSIQLKKYSQAISSFTKSLEFNPYHPWETKLYYHIGRCHYALGAFDRAITVVRALIQKAESEQTPLTDWRIYNLLGDSHFALGQYQLALESYNQALDLAPQKHPHVDITRRYRERAKALSHTQE